MKIISASAGGAAVVVEAKTFFDSNNLFMSVSKNTLILWSILVGKLIFPMSERYLRGIL